jgi:glutathione S-transferase
MLMRWSRNMPRPASQWPALARLAELIRGRETWRQVYAVEGLSGW